MAITSIGTSRSRHTGGDSGEAPEQQRRKRVPWLALVRGRGESAGDRPDSRTPLDDRAPIRTVGDPRDIYLA